VNFIAHMEVGELARPAGPQQPGHRLRPFLVGTALPDLAGIGRFRLEPDSAAGELAEGIRVHHRTDSVFHADGRVRELMAQLRTALLASGLARGPARACGHVGVELLLDGRLLAEPSVADRADALLIEAADPGTELVALVAPDRRPAWRDHLGAIAERIAPAAYVDPDLVAARLHRILGRRPLLVLRDEHVVVVAAELRAIQPQVDAVAHAVVADTAAAVA
jgi:hypothetical protein